MLVVRKESRRGSKIRNNAVVCCKIGGDAAFTSLQVRGFLQVHKLILFDNRESAEQKWFDGKGFRNDCLQWRKRHKNSLESRKETVHDVGSSSSSRDLLYSTVGDHGGSAVVSVSIHINRASSVMLNICAHDS